MPIVEIAKIKVGERSRKMNGYLDSLERSIKLLGVLQPIGVTTDMKLLFGGRRLQACKNLGLKEIPARIFDLNSDNPAEALKIEREENEHRRDLTPSEKTELAIRIEEALGNRVGRPKVEEKEITPNLAELPKEPARGKENREIAAEAVGMKKSTYDKAKTVVQSGNQEVIRKMDSGEMSIHKAYNEVRPQRKSMTIKITLNRKPEEDAELLSIKAGDDYCEKLAFALLKRLGHKIEVGG